MLRCGCRLGHVFTFMSTCIWSRRYTVECLEHVTFMWSCRSRIQILKGSWKNLKRCCEHNTAEKSLNQLVAGCEESTKMLNMFVWKTCPCHSSALTDFRLGKKTQSWDFSGYKSISPNSSMVNSRWMNFQVNAFRTHCSHRILGVLG